MNQDLTLSAAVLHQAETLEYAIAPGRGLWMHVATGTVLANGYYLEAGDAMAVEDEPGLKLLGQLGGGEVLVFDAK